MPENTYELDNVVRVSVVFKNSAGVNADPTAIQFQYQPENASVTTKIYGTDVEVVKDSTGNYHVDLTVSSAGRWWTKWKGTGAIIAADENSFYVTQTQLG